MRSPDVEQLPQKDRVERAALKRAVQRVRVRGQRVHAVASARSGTGVGRHRISGLSSDTGGHR